MANYIQLPNGAYYPALEGEDYATTVRAAYAKYPEAFGGEKNIEEQPKSGFMPALKAGFSNLKGDVAALAGRTGIMGLPEAEKYIAEQEAYQKKTFAPTTKSFTEAPLTNIAELAAGSIPYMAAPVVAGLGAAALPVTGLAGTALGLGAAGLTSAAQFTGSNISRQVDTGKKLGETDLTNAALASIPMAALDTVSMRMIPGLGQIFERAGLNISAKAANDLAKEGIKKTAADYLLATGKTMGIEGLTEAGQQVFERMQAGLDIADPAARAEYFDNFLGGAVLGGILAPAGRYVERGQEQGRFDKNQRDAQKQRSLEESQAKAEAEAKLEAERQTPEYALNAQQVYQAAEQRQAELLAQLHKGGKENKLTEEQKQDNRATTLQLKEHAAVLSDAAKDYRSVKGVIAAETARKAQEAEQARIDAMSPEDFMLEQMKQGEGQGLQTSRRTKGRGQLYENEPLTPPAVDTSVQDYAATKMEEAYSNGLLPIRNASTNMLDNAGDFINFLADDFGMASRMVQEGKGVPGLSKKDNALLLSGLNLRLLQESKDSLAQKTADLSAQGTRAPKPTTGRGAFAEAYLSDADRLEQDRLAGEREDTIAKMQKYAAMPRDVVEQGELFGTERSGVLAGQRPDTEAQLAELESQLQAAYAARNTAPGMRNRTSERISTLVEQIKDLRERAAKSTEQGRTDFGTETQSLQEQLGSLPEQLQKQRDATAARTTAFGKLADVKNTEQADAARQEVLESLIAEIELGRGAKLKPETITQIEKDAGGILDAALRDNKDANPDLDSLSARWRSGTRATFDSASVTKTPLGASPEMLIEQLQKAFVNRDRQGNLTKYDDKTQTLLQQLVDNFGSFSANPDRRNLASDWLHRVTVTGRPAPELETEIRDELATLEKAKISETQTIERETAFGTARRPETAVQLELPERFMPKEVEGKAPEKAATSFSSAGEFQKYLASDALKSVRESLGLTKQTSARMHERLGVFRKKVDRLTGQLTALQSRKMELQRLKGAEANTARAIINDAEARLKAVADQLDLELRDLQVDYLKASEKFDFSAQTVSDIGQRIADNIGKFEAVDDPVVEAAKVTAQYKADFAEAMQQPVNKKNYSAIRKARQYIIDAINAQRKLANKAPARFVAFLDADLNLQMQLQEEERIMDAAAKELLSAGLALEETAKKQNRSRKNKKALDTAQKELADALGLQKSAIADVDAQLEKVATDIEATKKGIVRTRRTLTSLETPPKSEFDMQLAATTQARPSSEERAAKAESDRAKLQAFQDTAARLSAIPGQRIDFTKRREWLDLVAASTENFDSIAQDIKDATNGIEELQIRSAIAEEKQLTSTDPVEKEKLQKTIDTNTERIAELETAKKQYENSHKKMVVSVDRATKAASSDPEVAAAFTAVIDKRLDKLVKTINKKVADIAQKIDPKTNIKVPAKTMAQRRKDLAMFKKELVVLSAQRSNRLGIARIDAVTDKQVAPKKAAKGTAEEQQSVDEALQRMQEYGAEKERLKALQEQRKKLVATKVPKVKAKQAERVEKIRALQETIIAQKALVGKLAPKKVGAISAAARKQSSAPKKLLTGTKESKEEVGVVKQPIVEERNVVQPTAKKAIADANTIAKEKLAAAKPLTQDEIADLSLAQHDALVDAVQKMVADTERELADLQEKINYSNKSKLVAYTSTEYKNKLKTAKVTKEAVLGTAKANLKALLEEETALPEDVSPIDLGEEDLLLSRGTPVEGQTRESLGEELRRAMGGDVTSRGTVEIHNSVDDYLQTQAPDVRSELRKKIPSDAKGFAQGNKAVLFAENIGKNEGLGVLLHEVGVHIGFRNFFNEGQYKALVNQVKQWAKRNDGSAEEKVGKAAVRRVEAAETENTQVDDELLAYAVEEAVRMGVNPQGVKGGSALSNWLKMVLASFKKALTAFGINANNLKAGDLVNFAYGCAQLELKGTWHGSDAAFTKFDVQRAGAGEGAFDRRFDADNSLGAGPYTTLDKEYGEYYQHAVPFGKAANETGYGNKTYEDYRSMDEKFMTTSYKDLSVADLQSKYESVLLSRYLSSVSSGGSLNPTENKAAQQYISTSLDRINRSISDLENTLASREKRKLSTDRLEETQNALATARKELKAANTLDVAKINGLTKRPAEGNLYRTLDDIPNEKIFSINSTATAGERPQIDALLKKYGDKYNVRKFEEDGEYYLNSLYYDMRQKLGVEKANAQLKDAGIQALEQKNDRKYIERAYIDNAPEILAVNINPVGTTDDILLSRKADYKSDDALSKAAQRVVAQPKTLLQKVRGNSNVLLEAQMEGADMRAGLIKALENAVKDPRTMGSTKLFRQAIFSITAADQHMPITQMAATMGPPKMFKDEKGYYEVRSSMENSAIDVFDSVQDIPDRYGNAEAKMGMASMYMIAQRALNKGLAKLDTGAMGVTEQELQDVMRSVDADPELKAALEKTRKLYNAYNKGMIEWLASPQVAAISRDDAKAFLKDEDYVPYYRVLPNGSAELVFGGEKTITIGDIKHQPYLAELKGGDAKIMPLNQSVMRNTMLLVTKGMTNMAQKNIAYAMQAAGAGQGKDKSNLMPVHKGQGVADASIIRWTQEPDPSDPKDKGERWLRIQTNDTMFGGIPAELIIKSMEGAHLTLPAFLKLGGMAGDLLRAGVTRTPIYLARQLIRDPFAATATAGLDYGPLTAIFRANKEFLKMTRGQSETGAKLIEKGLVQSGIFDGSPADMEKMALQLAGGESLSLLRKLFKGADSLAIKADAATRALIYDNAIKNGLSEVEASHAVRESMNFYKRGLSPTVQYASRMIPFFNAQIQGLSVLFKAARGNMPFDEQLKIRKKFINNAMMLTGFGIAYAMAMDDDEYYKNSKPRDRYSNFFMHLPGVDEPVKLPIPYEFGWFFSAGVAAADAIKGEVNTPQQLRALKDMFVGAIPGGSNLGMPQIIKPVAEVYANKSFFSGNPILSTRLEKLDPEAQYNANTTELAKWFGRMVPGLSPVQLEHIVSGYLGQVPLMVAASADSLFAKDSSIEEPTRKLSEMPLIGSSFQRKYGGEDADVVYKLAEEALQAKRTFDNYRSTGKIEDAKEYLQDHRAEIRVAPMALQYQKVMGQIRKQENIIRGSSLDGDAKAKRIEELNKQRQLQSERYMKAIQRAEAT